MKAEERHELKQNDLASWLQYGLPMWLKQNGSYVLLVLAVVFLSYQIYRLYQQKQETFRNQGWAELQSLQNPATAMLIENPLAKLQSIIDTYDIKELRAQAYLTQGTVYSRLLLSPEQMNSLKISREEALTKAYEAYKKANETLGDDTLVAAKSMLGMAAVKEDRGEWDAAAKDYAAMADKNGRFGKTPFAALAAQRLATLDDRRHAPPLASEIPTLTTRPAALPEAGGLGGFGGGLDLGGGIAPTFTAPDMLNPGGVGTIVPPSTAPASQPR